MPAYRIGEVARMLGLSVDTLRYYEKLGLLPPVARTGSGLRLYDERHLSALRFIQRAQAMDFRLAEIRTLLQLRTDPRSAKPAVRALARSKLADITTRLASLASLRDELESLLELCAASGEECPIISGLEAHEEEKT